ncbi:unnamed protein product, partial [Bubo scandiacus]
MATAEPVDEVITKISSFSVPVTSRLSQSVPSPDHCHRWPVPSGLSICPPSPSPCPSLSVCPPPHPACPPLSPSIPVPPCPSVPVPPCLPLATTLLKAEGQAHQPNFTFRVTVGDISCTGQGPSKKAAKHKAAEVALKLLKRGGTCWSPPPPRSPGEGGTGVPRVLGGVRVGVRVQCRMRLEGAGGSLGSECNPVGALQELVVQKGWRLPEYTVTQESGPAHRKEFTMTCRVERFVEIGSGTSKKLAKRNAAAKMLVRIHNVPMEPREGSEAEVEEDQFSMAGPRLEGLRGRAPGCTWDSLRNSAGEKIVQLRSHPLAPMGAGGLRPPPGALRGAELRHQLPRHRCAEPQRAAPVLGGTLDATGHGLSRRSPLPRRRPLPGRPQRPPVPPHHGGGQI